MLDHAALIRMASVAALDRDGTFCPASLEGLDDWLGMRDAPQLEPSLLRAVGEAKGDGKRTRALSPWKISRLGRQRPPDGQLRKTVSLFLNGVFDK